MITPRPTESRLLADLASLKRERDELREALNQIASWTEGDTVNGSFDEPNSAAVARAVLKRTKGK